MRVLVLDLQYQPLEIVNWQKAIVLVISNKAEVLEEHDQVIRSPSIQLKIPSVIRKKTAKFRLRNVSFSRRNVFARDNYECQYCGKQKAYNELTFDHIIPVIQNGETSWENIVACCKPCNGKKADNTPEQARMTLRKKPRRPEWLEIFRLKLVEADPKSWLYYIDKPK